MREREYEDKPTRERPEDFDPAFANDDLRETGAFLGPLLLLIALAFVAMGFWMSGGG